MDDEGRWYAVQAGFTCVKESNRLPYRLSERYHMTGEATWRNMKESKEMLADAGDRLNLYKVL